MGGSNVTTSKPDLHNNPPIGSAQATDPAMYSTDGSQNIKDRTPVIADEDPLLRLIDSMHPISPHGPFLSTTSASADPASNPVPTFLFTMALALPAVLMLTMSVMPTQAAMTVSACCLGLLATIVGISLTQPQPLLVPKNPRPRGWSNKSRQSNDSKLDSAVSDETAYSQEDSGPLESISGVLLRRGTTVWWLATVPIVVVVAIVMPGPVLVLERSIVISQSGVGGSGTWSVVPAFAWNCVAPAVSYQRITNNNQQNELGPTMIQGPVEFRHGRWELDMDNLSDQSIYRLIAKCTGAPWDASTVFMSYDSRIKDFAPVAADAQPVIPSTSWLSYRAWLKRIRRVVFHKVLFDLCILWPMAAWGVHSLLARWRKQRLQRRREHARRALALAAALHSAAANSRPTRRQSDAMLSQRKRPPSKSYVNSSVIPEVPSEEAAHPAPLTHAPAPALNIETKRTDSASHVKSTNPTIFNRSIVQATLTNSPSSTLPPASSSTKAATWSSASSKSKVRDLLASPFIKPSAIPRKPHSSTSATSATPGSTTTPSSVSSTPETSALPSTTAQEVHEKQEEEFAGKWGEAVHALFVAPLVVEKDVRRRRGSDRSVASGKSYASVHVTGFTSEEEEDTLKDERETYASVRGRRGVVIKAFDPTMVDELRLVLGHVICVYEGFDDGWAMGADPATQAEGVFPLACLRLLEDPAEDDYFSQTVEPSSGVLSSSKGVLPADEDGWVWPQERALHIPSGIRSRSLSKGSMYLSSNSKIPGTP